MLPDPMMTEPTFMASPESHPTFADPFDHEVHAVAFRRGHERSE